MYDKLGTGTYFPVLFKLINMTEGPILELGTGFCSTQFLHWMCFPTKRKLVSYENNPRYFGHAQKFISDYHEVHCIDDWDSIDISGPWSIVLVDHSPGIRRRHETMRLTHADYVVIHDSENRSNRRYKLIGIRHLFRYRYKYTDVYPHTSVWSNKFDLKDFTV